MGLKNSYLGGGRKRGVLGGIWVPGTTSGAARWAGVGPEDSREQPHEAEEGAGGLGMAGLACLPKDPSGGDSGQMLS